MNDAKYIGLDVHQATISVAVLDSSWEAGDGTDSRNQSQIHAFSIWRSHKQSKEVSGG